MKLKRKIALLNEIPKNKCRYCGATENLTYDHKIPIIKGGSDDLKNIQVLCFRCNSMKSDLTHNQVKRLFDWFRDIQNNHGKI